MKNLLWFALDLCAGFVLGFYFAAANELPCPKVAEADGQIIGVTHGGPTPAGHFINISTNFPEHWTGPKCSNMYGDGHQTHWKPRPDGQCYEADAP